MNEPKPERTLLARLVHERNWTVHDFARHFDHTGRSIPDERPMTVSMRQAKRWLSGDTITGPHPSARRVLEVMFDHPTARLFAPPTAGTTPGSASLPARLVTGRPEGHDGDIYLGDPEEVSPTRRRDLLNLTATALGLSATGVAAITAPADRLAILERATAGSGAADAAEGALRTVVADYLHHPPAETLRRAIAMQQLTDAISAEHVLRPADQARVWRVSAVATGIRGWLENNAGRTTDARGSLREAHRRGELLEDPQIIAWTRYMQAVVEEYTGNPTRAEWYARDGLTHAPSGPQRAILLGDSLARARATSGDVSGVDTAVSEAREIVAKLTPEQQGPPDETRTIVDCLDTCSPLLFAQTAGAAYAQLGLPDRYTAVTAQARADAHADHNDRESLFYADEAVAVARSKAPDLDRVSVLARDSLRLAGAFQTGHITSRLNIIFAATEPYQDHPVIGDLADQVHAWRVARSTPKDLV
ncbi:hypothetical protein MXD61_26790 [Frankia sp. AgPm24]|uniref:hypothetical protein n=1 Tax=Frankia sp. AgPm24 TaxID=631128 RepID=UPI00200F64FC|nr:hypothetical protein [Frankia sp. AgPm24]MCK9925437.1 hypothetical protein [Frankia sp. AgPm24]